MHLRCGEVFHYCFSTNLLLSMSVKEHSAKLEAKVEWHLFSRHGVGVECLGVGRLTGTDTRQIHVNKLKSQTTEVRVKLVK